MPNRELLDKVAEIHIKYIDYLDDLQANDKQQSWARAAYFDFIDAALDRKIPIILDDVDGNPVYRLERIDGKYMVKGLR